MEFLERKRDTANDTLQEILRVIDSQNDGAIQLSDHLMQTVRDIRERVEKAHGQRISTSIYMDAADLHNVLCIAIATIDKRLAENQLRELADAQ